MSRPHSGAIWASWLRDQGPGFGDTRRRGMAANKSAERPIAWRYRRGRATASDLRDDADPSGADVARAAVAIHPTLEKCPGSGVELRRGHSGLLQALI